MVIFVAYNGSIWKVFNMKKINFIQYTYTGDQILTLESIKSIFKSFSTDRIGKVVIVNDWNNPISEEVKRELLKIGDGKLKVIDTFYDRNKNIKGPKHFTSYIEILKLEFTNDDEIVVKVDPDTFILNDFFLNPIINDENCFYLGDFAYSSWFGIGYCYAFKTSIINDVLDSLSECSLEELCPEDVEFGKRAIFKINKFDLSKKQRDIKTRYIKNVVRQRIHELGMVKTPMDMNLYEFKNLLNGLKTNNQFLSVLNIGSYSRGSISKDIQSKNVVQILNFINNKQ